MDVQWYNFIMLCGVILIQIIDIGARILMNVKYFNCCNIFKFGMYKKTNDKELKKIDKKNIEFLMEKPSNEIFSDIINN